MTKVIAVTGGKGGTGKTLLAVNLAFTLSEVGRTLLVDADVDNPCSKGFVKSKPTSREVVKEFRPKIVEEKCRLCGACVQNCHEHALMLIPGKRVILMPELCEGCGVCKLVCPFEAIEDSWVEAGYIEEHKDDHHLDAVIGELKPTTRRTPVMILKTLRHAEKKMRDYDYVVVDSPPGTGSGIYTIMMFSDVIIVVTEPTRLGLTDLKKLIKLYKKTESKKIFAVINKVGLRGEMRVEVENALRKAGIVFWHIPYDISVVKSYVNGNLLVKTQPESRAAKAIRGIAEELINVA